MSEHIERTIADFEQELRLKEEEVKGVKKLINSLRAKMGQPVPYPDVDAGKAATSSTLRGDEYLDKSQHSACRDILERRKRLGVAPVSAEEIYGDLIAGGYQFETEDVPNRKRGLSQMLSKASSVFYRIPSNGMWGLLEWYPGVKAPKKKASDPAEELGEELSQMTLDLNKITADKKPEPGPR